jgi:cytochrome b6-f complex iron-sulfur subunit
MSDRRLRRYVESLLRGRRPRPFPADQDEAAQVRAAIELRAARPGSDAPSEAFVAGLHRRLAAELEAPAPKPAPTRRRVVQAASVAAAAVVGATTGATVDHIVAAPAADGGGLLSPNVGTWHTVAASADLTEGTVVPFDVGTVNGFVQRTGGRLTAVSGVCTHLGCRLALDRAARELTCPCHNAAFTVTGQLVRHQLRAAPPPLPRIAVREQAGSVQIFAP